MHTFRFNLLVVALVALVSLCTARTIITTEKCSTRYCDRPVKVYRTTKTVHASARYLVTRWKTVNKPSTTKWVTKTTTKKTTWTTTITRTTDIRTVWIGTSTHTRKLTVTSPTYTETLDRTTVSVTPPTKTIPAPSGFVPVSDDPDNVEHKKNVWVNRSKRDVELESIEKRNAEPEPVPEPIPEPEPEAAANKYASAVTCTKSIITKTGTSDVWKTTTKTTGTTTRTTWSTWTSWGSQATVTAKNVVIIVTTTSKYKIAFATSYSTVYTGATTYLTTVTTTLPVPTFYAGCTHRNQGPPQWQQNGQYHAGGTGPDPGEAVVTVWSNGTIYDCCVACHTYNEGGATCIGSVYNYQGEWGAPSCWMVPDECEPWTPPNSSKCDLIIADPKKPGFCRKHTYIYENYYEYPPCVVSNGPTCARWKYKFVPRG